MAILVTNSVCWARFERASLGNYSLAALSWMFRRSKIPWELLFQMGVRVVLRKYGITEGVLAADDSDKKRSKVVKRIFKAHKIKDKASGGYIMGQSFVLLVLVTPLITIPVGFAFYMPDPVLKAWKKKDEQLRKKGVKKKKRPLEPPRNPLYPTKEQLVLSIIAEFKKYNPSIKVKAILADALYGTANFMNYASIIYDGVQVISQIRSNQKIRFVNKEMSVEEYFSKHPGIKQTIKIRGGEKTTVSLGSARLYVGSHKKKRFVIALKYEGEDEYRYIVASNLSWRTLDIVQTYTLRWLVEVFFQDWKSYEGWGQLTKQPDSDGSSRGLILSLLIDHCLFFHPDQKAQLENKLPAYTVGSISEKVKVECLIEFISSFVETDNIELKLEKLKNTVDDVFTFAPSKKHMVNRKLGRMEDTKELKYRAEAVALN